MAPSLLLLVMALLLIGGRSLANQAFYELGPEERLKILQGFRHYRVISALPLIAVIVLMLGIRGRLPEPTLGPAAVAFLSAVALLIGIKFWYVDRRFRELNLPRDYRRKYFIGSGMINLGVAVYFAAIVARWILQR